MAPGSIAGLLLLMALALPMPGMECSRLEPRKNIEERSPSGLELRSKFVAPSGPNPGGNAAILGGKKEVSRSTLIGAKFDAPSGPNPGGNRFVQGAKLEIELGSKMPKGNFTPNPGPSKDHNAQTMGSSSRVAISSKLPKGSTPGSSPSPGHNSVSRMLKVPSPPSSKIACTDGLDSSSSLLATAQIFSHN
ncbi:hypothetical protein SELMODRAFT_416359 [Selaginella moellendorffii]|uniref:Uncharacterized protein n=1 Tax=Selaginella moellendorffii TaxID=88036 RepID=D8RZ16_SELML|nr:hypothetical protein SELMODRAFT_416359 [Selaginella moellendorffii]